MKRSRPHNVYLSQQALDIMIALKTCSGNSRFLLPSRYNADAPMSRATFNRITVSIIQPPANRACSWAISLSMTYAEQVQHF